MIPSGFHRSKGGLSLGRLFLSTSQKENATKQQSRRANNLGIATASHLRLPFKGMANPKRSLKRRVLHAGGWQVAKRLAKMVPLGGTVVAVVLIGDDIRRKGVFRGAVNSGLDAIPVFGLAKNAVELVSGDLIPDKNAQK